MLDKEKVFEQCFDRWDDTDYKIEYFMENYDEWFEQIPSEIQNTVLELLSFFEYYSQSRINSYLHQLYFDLEKHKDYNEESTYYTPLKSKKGIANSSGDYLYSYRQIHNISKYRIIEDLKTYNETQKNKISKIQNIVIIDDYCGSGSSLRFFIEKNIEYLIGKKIFYMVTYIMEESISEIEKISKDNNIKINIIFINKGVKAFENKLFQSKKEEQRKLLQKNSKKINIPDSLALGWHNSESLVSFYNDTPNNTIGLFWFDSKNYFSLFPRDSETTHQTKRPTPRTLKEAKDNRNNQNYDAKLRRIKI